MNRYRVTLFEHDYTFADQENWSGPEYVPACRVASAVVRACSRREAAARAYVRTVGRARAHRLWEMNAPLALVRAETRWRGLARSLAKARNWLGDCLVHDNMVVAFYFRVQRLPASLLPVGQHTRIRRRGQLLRALEIPSEN